MAEWISIDQWPDCARMERPGIVFEVRNRDGQSLLTNCTVTLPEQPFDWTSPAVEFRAVPEQPAEHSTPIPPPAEQP
jgi:hypothetical protein